MDARPHQSTIKGSSRQRYQNKAGNRLLMPDGRTLKRDMAIDKVGNHCTAKGSKRRRACGRKAENFNQDKQHGVMHRGSKTSCQCVPKKCHRAPKIVRLGF